MTLVPVDRRWPMFLFCSHGVKPSFQAALDPWFGKFPSVMWSGRQWRDPGVPLLPRRLAALQVGVGKLSSDEARRIGKAIARIPSS